MPTRSKKLLQVATVPVFLEAFLLPFASHFRGLGWTVEAAANGMSANAAGKAAFDKVHDVPWSRNPAAPSNITAARRIRALVKAGDFDIVHVHTPVAAYVTRRALMHVRPRPAVVYTAHGFHFHASGNPIANRVFASLERWAAPRTDWLVVINSEDREAALRLRLVPAERLSYLPGIGVDIEGFERRVRASEEPERLRAELGVAPGAHVVLMVAEFTPNKRHADAIRAIASLRAQGLDVQLLFAGIGPMMSETKRLAEKLGVASSVRFLGYRNDVPALLKLARALLLLSEREGLPRSVLEAMAVGVPVIGTRIRGVTDLLEGGAGFLVPVGDVGEIAASLRGLLTSPEGVTAVVERARARVEKSAIPAILEGYEAIYEAVLVGRD